MSTNPWFWAAIAAHLTALALAFAFGRRSGIAWERNRAAKLARSIIASQIRGAPMSRNDAAAHNQHMQTRNYNEAVRNAGVGVAHHEPRKERQDSPDVLAAAALGAALELSMGRGTAPMEQECDVSGPRSGRRDVTVENSTFSDMPNQHGIQIGTEPSTSSDSSGTSD